MQAGHEAALGSVLFRISMFSCLSSGPASNRERLFNYTLLKGKVQITVNDVMQAHVMSRFDCLIRACVNKETREKPTAVLKAKFYLDTFQVAKRVT